MYPDPSVRSVPQTEVGALPTMGVQVMNSDIELALLFEANVPT